MSWQPPVYPGLPTTTVDLTHSGFTKVQTADWTITNPDASTLRCVKGAAGATMWDNTTETGLALVWPVDLGTPGQDRLIQTMMRLSSIPGTQGLGAGVGVSQGLSPVGTNWTAIIAEREAAASFEVFSRSDGASGSEASGVTDTGFGHQNLYGSTKLFDWHYTADGTIGGQYARLANHNITGSAYLTLFLYAPAGGGTIDITKIAYVSQFLTSTP